MRAPLVATELRLSIWSLTPALRALHLYYKVAIFQPELVLRALDLRYTAAIVQLELKTCILRTRLVLQSCDLPARAGNLYLYLHYKVVTFQLVLETCTLRALDLYFKVAILQLELVMQSCDFLETRTLRTRLVLQSRAGAGNLYFAYKTCTTMSRFSSWSWKPVLRVLDLSKLRFSS